MAEEKKTIDKVPYKNRTEIAYDITEKEWHVWVGDSEEGTTLIDEWFKNKEEAETHFEMKGYTKDQEDIEWEIKKDIRLENKVKIAFAKQEWIRDKETFEIILRNDKTPSYGYGEDKENRLNRDGIAPDEPGKRWMAPLEIARSELRDTKDALNILEEAIKNDDK